MGKRRKEGPQADKYNPHATSDEEDEEEIENNLEKVILAFIRFYFRVKFTLL